MQNAPFQNKTVHTSHKQTNTGKLRRVVFENVKLIKYLLLTNATCVYFVYYILCSAGGGRGVARRGWSTLRIFLGKHVRLASLKNILSERSLSYPFMSTELKKTPFLAPFYFDKYTIFHIFVHTLNWVTCVTQPALSLRKLQVKKKHPSTQISRRTWLPTQVLNAQPSVLYVTFFSLDL